MKSALFSIVLAIFEIPKEAAVAPYRRESLQQSFADFDGGTLKGILTLTLPMFVVLVPFFRFT